MLASKQPHFWTTMLANKQDKAGNHTSPKLTSARTEFDSLSFQTPLETWLFVEGHEGPKKEKPAFSVALRNHFWSLMLDNKQNISYRGHSPAIMQARVQARLVWSRLLSLKRSRS